MILRVKKIDNVFILLNSIDQSLKNFDLEPFAKSGLNINYSKEDFINNINGIIKPLSTIDSVIALGYYDFAIIEGLLKGYPTPNNSEIELDVMVELSNDKHFLKKIIQELKPEIDKYSSKNKISLSVNKHLETILNEIIGIIPEFITTVGKIQHVTHAYTLDIHILKTMQNFIKTDAYKSIREDDQNITKLAILLHDIGKEEFVIDRFHPDKSSIVATKILDRLNINSDTKERINNFVLHHQWVRDLEEEAKPLSQIAHAFKRPGDFHIAVLFSLADLHAIGNGFEIGKEETYLKYFEQINDQIHKLNSIH